MQSGLHYSTKTYCLSKLKNFSWEVGFWLISPFDKNLFCFVKISCLDTFICNIFIFLFQITFSLKYVIYWGTKIFFKSSSKVNCLDIRKNKCSEWHRPEWWVKLLGLHPFGDICFLFVCWKNLSSHLCLFGNELVWTNMQRTPQELEFTNSLYCKKCYS